MKKVRVLLIGAEDEENLAIRYLASCLEKVGHIVKIAPCSRLEQITYVVKIMEKYKPDLVGISIAFQSMSKTYFCLIEEIRKAGFKGHITVGGHFPSFEFKRLLESQKGVDSVIRFEGEQAIVMLADSLVKDASLDSVPNLVYRTDEGIRENRCIKEFQPLDKLPFPKREKNPQLRLGEKFATLVGSRGCWHSRCLFCCIGAFHSQKEGERIALRSSESIAEEIAELYFRKGVRLFQFHDDNFLLPSFEESCKRLNSIKNALEAKNIDLGNIAFLIKARPDSIDESVAKALRELGTVGVFLGVENASETGLKVLIRGQTMQDVERAIAALEKQDIAITFNLLVFHPNATVEEIEKNIEFMKKNIQHPFDFGRAEVVAGSPLEIMLINENRLLGNWPSWNYKVNDEKVEKIFQVNLHTFRKKNSAYVSTIQSAIALAYNAAALKKLHKGKVADELADEGNRIVEEINSFIIDKVENMKKLALSSASNKEVESLSKELDNSCNYYTQSMLQLSSKMVRLAIADRVFKFFGVRRHLQEIQPLRRIFSI